MIDAKEILPPHAGRAEIALVQAVVDQFDISIPVRDVWNPATAPVQILPWLAWALSVDFWDEDWTEAQKRAAIAGSAAYHRRKGTVASVRDALALLGHPNAEVIEDNDLAKIGSPGLQIGGSWTLGRTWVIGPRNHSWADYWVELRQGVTSAQARILAQRLREVAPARCRLRSISIIADAYLIGDGRWTIGDTITIGNTYIREVA